MKIKYKKEKLLKIYNRFERDIFEFKKTAACQIGCADCCEQINTFAKPLRAEIWKRLAQNKAQKENNKFGKCTFLKK